jgi:hypothetical protein
MKSISTSSFFTMIALSLLLTSCGISREYYAQNPSRTRNFYSLIVSPVPGFTMSRYPDGSYYHRSPQGFLYWQGLDNRFYLDKKFLTKVNYNKKEYKEWKRYSKKIKKQSYK